MPAYEQILATSAGRVATIALNRPEKLNAWTRQMEAEVRDAIEGAAADDSIRAIVLQGAGKGFCAGADLSLLETMAASSGTAAANLSIEGPATAPAEFRYKHAWLLSVPKPIIAAIHGPCVGLGLVVSLYCDFRFAAENARFSVIFSRRGLVAEYGIAWMLPRLVGLGNAIDLAFTSKMIDAREALRIGLATRVLPDANFHSDVHEIARELAEAVSPRSLAVMKRQMYRALDQNLGESFGLAIEEMRSSLCADDFREGVAHFLEKRPAAFTGR
jgi:enoyl-CoA hydratase/carnithine racemase